MDYEKNKTIAIMKQMVADGKITQADAEKYCPEMAESEDEKTKRILHSISSKMSFHLHDIFTEEEFQCFDTWSSAWVEKQGEQKPADKVEPKFHEGEWVCENEPNNYARFIQILEIVNIQGKERYKISRDIHNDEDIVEFDFVEKHYHKFDIKDAKDGDVLATEDWVFIFKKMNPNKKPTCYCHYDIELGFHIDTNSYISTGYEIHPATKEQRDLLFQKMKEAGYEWNAEKKELKKIEQKPVVIPKFRVGDIIRWKKVSSIEYTIKEINDKGYINTADGIMDISQTDIEFELVKQNPPKYSLDEAAGIFLEALSLSPYNNKPITDAQIITKELLKFLEDGCSYNPDALNNKPTGWSAEDEAILTTLIHEIQANKREAKRIEHKSYDKILSWLESLKDRCLPQPKQEWSEKDKKIISDVVGFIHDGALPQNKKEYYVEKLLALWPQKQWKPSEEQIKALRWVLNHIPYDSHKEKISGLLEQLLKLYNYDKNR